MAIVRRVFFGTMPEEFEGHIGDVTRLDKLALGILSFILIALGMFPGWMAPLVSSGVDSVMRLLGGA
jgi:NADH:ubiquinone oxidoreductase subunit 4 (subunit M)